MSTGASSDTLLVTGASLNHNVLCKHRPNWGIWEYGDPPQQFTPLTLQTCDGASRELCMVKRWAQGLLVMGKATASTQSRGVWGSMLLS